MDIGRNSSSDREKRSESQQSAAAHAWANGPLFVFPSELRSADGQVGPQTTPLHVFARGDEYAAAKNCERVDAASVNTCGRVE